MSLNEIIILLTIIVTLNDAIIKFIISNYALPCAGVEKVYTHLKGFLLVNKKVERKYLDFTSTRTQS